MGTPQLRRHEHFKFMADKADALLSAGTVFLKAQGGTDWKNFKDSWISVWMTHAVLVYAASKGDFSWHYGMNVAQCSGMKARRIISLHRGTPSNLSVSSKPLPDYNRIFDPVTPHFVAMRYTDSQIDVVDLMFHRWFDPSNRVTGPCRQMWHIRNIHGVARSFEIPQLPHAHWMSYTVKETPSLVMQQDWSAATLQAAAAIARVLGVKR